MRRILLALALVALAPSTLPAVPITGYAFGQVIQDRSSSSSGGGPNPYHFTVGEAVYVRFTYDLDPPSPLFDGWVHVAFDLHAGGFSFSAPAATNTRVDLDGETLRLIAGRDPWAITMRLTGDDGTLAYSRDLGAPTEGFFATLTRVADDSAFPTPEPSGLLSGAIGMALVGLFRLYWGRVSAPNPGAHMRRPRM